MPFIERPFRLASVQWDDIQGKPDRFPPEAHAPTHGANGSDPVTVDWNTQIANRPSAFPPEAHVHSAADIASGRFGLSRLPDGPSGKVLVAQGIGNDPIWDDVPGAGPHAQTHAWNGSDPISPASILALDCEYTSRTIYVDSQYGSDTSGDGSESAPFQTFAKAISTVRQTIADGVTITLVLKGRGPSYPYTLGSFGRICIGTGRLVIQGELTPQTSGNVTSGTPTTITDSSKSWNSDQWAGKLVKVVRGALEYWRLIRSNTSNTLTVVGRLEITPAPGDTYTIYDWGTFLTDTQNEVIGGNVTFRYLAVTSVSGRNAFRLGSFGTYIFEDCWVQFSSGTCIGIHVSEHYASVTVRRCFIDGQNKSGQALAVWDKIGDYIFIERSFFRNISNELVRVTGPGCLVYITRGTVLSGANSCILLGMRAHGVLWAPTVNGAVDKNVISNGTAYGIALWGGASANHTGTNFVDYSGNGTDRFADSTTYAWYTDY